MIVEVQLFPCANTTIYRNIFLGITVLLVLLVLLQLRVVMPEITKHMLV